MYHSITDDRQNSYNGKSPGRRGEEWGGYTHFSQWQLTKYWRYGGWVSKYLEYGENNATACKKWIQNCTIWRIGGVRGSFMYFIRVCNTRYNCNFRVPKDVCERWTLGLLLVNAKKRTYSSLLFYLLFYQSLYILNIFHAHFYSRAEVGNFCLRDSERKRFQTNGLKSLVVHGPWSIQPSIRADFAVFFQFFFQFL